MERAASQSRLILLFVWAAGVAFLSSIAWTDWLPQDDGLLAHTAERMLHGELPHRDFDAVYTGGLEWGHALAFKLFGIRLTSLRILLLLVASLFIPVFYWLAARVVSPTGAALITVVAVVWSLPVYFASMPSWHILFLSTFGMATLFRYFDTGHRRWLVATGVLAGLACLMKVNGLLLAAGVGISFVFVEQAEHDDSTQRHAFPSLLVWTACGSVALGLLAIVGRHPGLMELVHYAAPGLGIAAVLAVNERRLGGGLMRARLSRWARLLGPFLLGLILPIALFLIPYVLSGSLSALLHGLFVLPQRRLTGVTSAFPPAWTLLLSTPFVLLLALGPRIPANLQRVAAAIVAVVLLLLAALGSMPLDYRLVSLAVRGIIPVAVVAGCLLLVRSTSLAPQRRRDLFVVLSVAAFVSLLQYPFPAYIYFCYVLPLGVLALAYVIGAQPAAPRPLWAAMAGGLALFGALWVARSTPVFVGQTPEQLSYVPLELPRGGIEVPDVSASYLELIEEVQKHSSDGEAIYAAPDLPEVYFLANRRNPTRTMYDLFDDDAGRPERVARILRTLSEQHVRTVVLRDYPPFSKPVSSSLVEALRRQYPEQKRIDIFLVMWRP